MKMSEAFVRTQKEIPQGAEIPSHVLMLRAGLIRKLAAGAYIYLPLGVRVLRKVQRIIREEMNGAGALELLMPALQPVELWKRSGRRDALGEDMICFTDRHGKETVLGPTHEEVITDLMAREITSYRQLPVIVYQIQTKFRDETRPRFGVIRSREFIMKDAYSFDADNEGLKKSYTKMYEAYCRIFTRAGLAFIPVEADSGVMGGKISHEFMTPSPHGEDRIIRCAACGYAASSDAARTATPRQGERPADSSKCPQVEKVHTPGVSTVGKVCGLLKKAPRELVKTLLFITEKGPRAFLVRGDHELNEAKAAKAAGVRVLRMAGSEEIERITGGAPGFSGPVSLRDVVIIADYSVREMSECVTGANERDMHLVHVMAGRDFTVGAWADVRMVGDGDPCPECGQPLKAGHAIEMGHTFQLGTRYSRSLGARFLDDSGKENEVIMGCYGIGVNRIIAACIETSHDKDGIIWPYELAPYHVAVIPLNTGHAESLAHATRIYHGLREQGIEVIMDDRDESAGVKFKDADLIGFPLQVIVGEKSLARGVVEVKTRNDRRIEDVRAEDALQRVRERIDAHSKNRTNPSDSA